MESFIAMSHAASWAQPPSQSTSSRRSLGHFRSLSQLPPAPSHSPRTPTFSPSKPASPSRLSSSASATFNLDDEMSTLPDPRSRAAMLAAEDAAAASGRASPSRHPDLNEEVATLSTKLINAINHQTVLDDTLSATRHELEAANERIRQLEAQNASQRELLDGHVWIRKSSVEAEKKIWQAKIADEKQRRLDTEKEKKKIEQELENLTTALFEEANKMVIAAKEDAQAEHEVLQRKNDQLKSQLADVESLLKSQQEQLSELKHVMEHMVTERDDQTNATAPSSPGLVKSDTRDDERPSTELTAMSSWGPSVEPSYPTSFLHLVQPVLRTDLSAFDDFVNLARLSRNRAGSRVSSGSMGALNALAFGLGGSTSSAHNSNNSTNSLTLNPSTPGNGSTPQSPNTPASAFSTNSNAMSAPIPNLKDTKFYKRVLAEDIEPTLRLDLAPGLSWLARRTVISAVTEGSLVVEPVPTNTTIAQLTKPQLYPCSLCGDSRTDKAYLRTHRFRTNETDSAQRHPLCKYCLTRVRSTCDFLGFLRMIKDGHWRADNEDHEKAAWEESVRLREQMFWARLGGGVIPAVQSGLCTDLDKSPRHSHEQSGTSEATIAKSVEAATRAAEEAAAVDFEKLQHARAEDPPKEPYTPPDQTEGAKSMRESVHSLDIKSSPGSEDTKRLSITIPPPKDE